MASSVLFLNAGTGDAVLGKITATGFNAGFLTQDGDITAGLIDGGSFEKNGAGVLTLDTRPSNTVQGVMINDGTLRAALPSNAFVSLLADRVWESQALHQESRVISGSGLIVLGNRRLTIAGPGPAEFSGEIQGTLSAVDSEALTFNLAGVFTFSGKGPPGATHVARGTVLLANPAGEAIRGPLRVGWAPSPTEVLVRARMTAPNQLAATVAVRLDQWGVLELDGHDQVLGLIVTTHPATLGYPAYVDLAGATLTVGSGNIERLVSGDNGALVKTGTGTLRVSDPGRTFAGLVTVEGGRLELPDRVEALDVRLDGGQLAAREEVGTIAATGGQISPGLQQGGLDWHIAILDSKDVTLSAAASYAVDMGPGRNAILHDVLRVTGTVDLANAALVLSGTPSAASGAAYVILENDGGDPITGTFAEFPKGASLTHRRRDFHHLLRRRQRQRRRDPLGVANDLPARRGRDRHVLRHRSAHLQSEPGRRANHHDLLPRRRRHDRGVANGTSEVASDDSRRSDRWTSSRDDGGARDV